MSEIVDLNSRPFRIGDWQVIPEMNRIIHPRGKHNIGSRTMQVLINLAMNQGKVVTKDTLMEEVWKDVVVTEDSLMKSISVLRKIFESPGENQPKIDTIRSVGYVLITPIILDNVQPPTRMSARRKPRLVAYAFVMVPVLAILGYIFQQSKKNKNDDGIIKITDSWSHERVPRFSPDGIKVMFASGTGGNNNLDICIKDLNTEEINHIENPDNIETDPIWSPDGKYIAFFRNDGKSIWIITRNLASKQEEQLIAINTIVNLSAMIWSADGKSIIYSDRPQGQRSFALNQVDIASRKITQLTHPHERIIGDSSPRISPDGNSLVFIRSFRYSNLYYHIIPGYGQLMIKNLETGEETKVGDQQEQITGVSWIDNDLIAYSMVYKNYKFRIIGQRLKSGEKFVIHESQEIIRNLDYHSQKNQLVFESWYETYNLWRFSDFDQKTNFSGRHMKNTHTSWNPSYHEKTNQLVFVSRQSGFAEIWVQDLSTGVSVQMTIFNGPIVRYPQWSPDGDRIIFELNDERNDDIYVLDLASGDTEQIIEDQAEETFPNWSADGQSIYYGSNVSGEFQIRKKNLKDGSDVQITKNGGARAIPHGDVLFYCFPYSRGLWQLKNGQESMIIENFIPNDIANWQLVNDKLFFISRSRYAKPELYYYDLIDETQHHYQSFSSQISYTFSGFTYDVQERTWLITQNDMIRSDIQMLIFDPSTMQNVTNSEDSRYAFSQ